MNRRQQQQPIQPPRRAAAAAAGICGICGSGNDVNSEMVCKGCSNFFLRTIFTYLIITLDNQGQLCYKDRFECKLQNYNRCRMRVRVGNRGGYLCGYCHFRACIDWGLQVPDTFQATALSVTKPRIARTHGFMGNLTAEHCLEFESDKILASFAQGYHDYLVLHGLSLKANAPVGNITEYWMRKAAENIFDGFFNLLQLPEQIEAQWKRRIILMFVIKTIHNGNLSRRNWARRTVQEFRAGRITGRPPNYVHNPEYARIQELDQRIVTQDEAAAIIGNYVLNAGPILRDFINIRNRTNRQVAVNNVGGWGNMDLDMNVEVEFIRRRAVNAIEIAAVHSIVIIELLRKVPGLPVDKEGRLIFLRKICELELLKAVLNRLGTVQAVNQRIRSLVKYILNLVDVRSTWFQIVQQEEEILPDSAILEIDVKLGILQYLAMRENYANMRALILAN